MRADTVTPGSIIQWNGVQALCLGKTPNHYLPDQVLVGWKPGQDAGGGSYGWHKEDLSLDDENEEPARRMLEKASCDRGWWLDQETQVKVIKAAIIASNSPGMSCRLCRDFAPMAEANRPDGISFICFPCRQGWIPLGY